jgi:peptidoglycan hydrolase-like protein with peptidoglycan-binding domain
MFINESGFKFPVASDDFNIGYDDKGLGPKAKPKVLDKDLAIHNSDYGPGDKDHQSRGGHKGIDIFAKKGTPLVACVDGVISNIGNPRTNPTGGNTVNILGNDGKHYYYAHLDKVSNKIKKGDKVKKGDFIGTVGDTGNAKGTHPHLHFSIYKGSYSSGSIDPWRYLKASVDVGEIDQIELKDIESSLDAESSENIEQGLEYFGQEGRDAQEFLDSIESLLDEGEDVLIEKQVEGGYTFDQRVLDLQTALILLGYELPKYGIDGLFGPETESSVMEYQVDHQLVDDGIIDYETIENIIVDLSEYSDEEINDFFNTSYAKEVKKSYDFVSDTEKVNANKLLSDLDSELGNTNLSKAFVANAVGESGLNVDARGDAGKYATMSERNQRRNVGGFCSFGLWQYNICGGLGVDLLKYYGVDPDTSSSDEKMEVLGDYDKQVSYMVNHVKRKGVVTQEKSVEDWVRWIVYEIERPKDKEGAVAKRVKHAARLGYLS